MASARHTAAASCRVLEKRGLRLQDEIAWKGTTVVWYAIDRPHSSG